MKADHQVKPLKYRVRSGLDLLASATGLLRFCERGMRRGLTILMYHRILPLAQCRQYPLASLIIPMEVFRRQMQWLAGHCRVLPVRRALADLAGGGPFKRPLVAVTFDDGYADNYSLAAPILEEHGLRGTFFVTSGFVEQGEPLWYDRAAAAWQRLSIAVRREFLTALTGVDPPQPANNPAIETWMAALKQAEPKIRMELVSRAESRAGGLDLMLYRPLTPDQTAILHRRGHEIASHTVRHPLLPQLADDELRQELTQSAGQLGEWINDKVTGFCYPNGDFDSRVEQALMEAGYNYACTTQTGLNRPKGCLTRLKRLPITIQRTTGPGEVHDALGFRAELSRLREWWR